MAGKGEEHSMSELVSTVMSLYKPDEGYLAEQLDTIDAQDYSDMEVVVYNDCPEDEDRSVFCLSHCRRHPVRYFHGTENLGYVKAFEKLVGLAKGDFIAFSDQDDRWLPGRISEGIKPLKEGCLLSVCDRMVIDGEGRVEVESWRSSHPKDPETNWNTGDHFVPQAVFTCYAIGMAIMVRSDVARCLTPFPICTGHDKWLVLGANAMGDCAFIDKALVQYRRHGTNVTGKLSGITCKADWHRTRVRDSCELARTFAERFPSSPDLPSIISFAQAREDGDVAGMWRYRYLAPKVAEFEILTKHMPNWIFKKLFCR